MITNNKNVIEILKKSTLDYDIKEITLLDTNESLTVKDLKMTSEGSIYTTNAVMLELVVRGDYRTSVQKKLNFKRMLRHESVANNEIQTIDYGNFIIMASEYDNGSEETTLLCYDLMVQTQREYNEEDINAVFPITAGNLLLKVANACELEVDTNIPINANTLIKSDYWANASYTYRDVLNHLAEVSTTTIKIKNNKLYAFTIEETGVTLQDNFVNLKLGEDYGKTNIMNISQEPQHDNVFFPLNAMDIPLEDRKELVFSN
uniref:hypothetical protein n=1 Tax=Pseudomonas sp. TaxID=306 RepID=UPI002609289B